MQAIMTPFRKLLCAESWAIILICTADLLTTLAFLNRDMAHEGNPIMAFCLEYGIAAFILAKIVLVMGPIIIIEYGRHRRPAQVRRMARMAILGYVGIYATLFLHINSSLLSGAPSSVIVLPTGQSVNVTPFGLSEPPSHFKDFDASRLFPNLPAMQKRYQFIRDPNVK